MFDGISFANKNIWNIYRATAYILLLLWLLHVQVSSVVPALLIQPRSEEHPEMLAKRSSGPISLVKWLSFRDNEIQNKSFLLMRRLILAILILF